MSRKAAALEAQPDLLEQEKTAKAAAQVELNEPDIEVTVEGETKPEVVVEKKEEAPALSALQKQVESLKESEKLAQEASKKAQLDREEALQRAQKSEEESVRHRSDATQSQLDAVENALGSAQSEISSAEMALENAINVADTKAQVAAYKKIAKAESNISRLEDGKSELEYQLRVEKARAKERPIQVEKTETRDSIDAMPIPERAKEWMREHREFADNPRKNLKLQSAHFDALDEGHKEFSTDYFVAVEKLLGLRKEQEVKKVDDDESDEDNSSSETKRAAIVSAPVSREGSSGNNPQGGSGRKVTLTKDQAEAARVSGVSEKVYAENLIKLNGLKKEGMYGEGR